MAEAADAVAERLDLAVNVIRRAGKAGAALDQLLDRRGCLFDWVAMPVPDKAAAPATRFQHSNIGRKRVVAGRVGERLSHNRRGPDIVGGKVGPAQALLLGSTNTHHSSVGETVGARGPAKLLRAFAIGFEHGPRSRQRQQSPDHMSTLGSQSA